MIRIEGSCDVEMVRILIDQLAAPCLVTQLVIVPDATPPPDPRPPNALGHCYWWDLHEGERVALLDLLASYALDEAPRFTPRWVYDRLLQRLATLPAQRIT